MGKFSKGARVRALETADEVVRGRAGTVYAKNWKGHLDVIFDDFNGGHDGTADDGSNNHWCVPKSYLAVLVEPALDPAPEPLTLEIGKRYRLRNGKVVGPLREGGWAHYPFQADQSVAAGMNSNWMADGQYFRYGGESELDIVAEWVDLAPEPAPKFKVGDWVRTTSTIGFHDTLPANTVGVVTGVNHGGDVAVEFAGWNDGNSGDRVDGAESRWWFFGGDGIELVTPAAGDKVLVDAVVLSTPSDDRVLLASGGTHFIVPAASVRAAA